MALPPIASRSPPISTCGSLPARSSRNAIIEVVVVLPCDPATAIPSQPFNNAANKSERWNIGNPLRCASNTSGFSVRMALETTIAFTSVRFAAAWPRKIVAPLFARRAVTSDACKSEPETRQPFFNRIYAIALIPTPPTPTKWNESISSNNN